MDEDDFDALIAEDQANLDHYHDEEFGMDNGEPGTELPPSSAPSTSMVDDDMIPDYLMTEEELDRIPQSALTPSSDYMISDAELISMASKRYYTMRSRFSLLLVTVVLSLCLL
jgi:hypothetical protein